MSLLRTATRTAVASSVHGRVQRRQQSRWAAGQTTAPAPVEAAPAAAAAPLPDGGSGDVAGTLAQLQQLAELRASGVLTNAEFEAQKARILRP